MGKFGRSTSKGMTYSKGFFGGGGGGYRPSSSRSGAARYYGSGGRSYGSGSSRSYSPPAYDQGTMDALQANLAKRQASDAARLGGRAGSLQYNKDQKQWHEYHGWGQIRPDGGVNFNDQTPDGKHSHTIRDQDFNVQRHRPEGK